MTPVEWELRLVNEVSASAKAAGIDLKEFAVTAKNAEGALQRLTLAEKNEASAAKEAKKEHEGFFGDMVKAEFWEQRMEKGIDLVEELTKGIFESAMEATDFDHKATLAMTRLTGSTEEAEDILTRARAAANGLGEDVDKVTIVSERLASAGFRGTALTAAIDAADDLAVVTGHSFDQTSQLFELLGADSGLSGRALLQLKQYPPLLAEIEKHFGFVPGAEKSFTDLAKQLNETPIKGQQGFALLEEMVMKIAHEKKLGDASVEIDTFASSLTRINNDWKMILGDMANAPAFAELRKSVSEIADYFDPMKGQGKEVEQVLAAAVEPVVDLVKQVAKNPHIITDFFGDAVAVAQTFATIVEGIAAAIKGIAHFMEVAGAELGTLSGGGSISDALRAGAEVQREQTLSPKQLAEINEANAINLPAPTGLPALPPIPERQAGGHVEETGLVTVHKGEEIVPAGVTENAPSAASGGGFSGSGHTFEFHFGDIHLGGEGAGGDEQLAAAKMKELVLGALMSALETMNQMKGGE